MSVYVFDLHNERSSSLWHKWIRSYKLQHQGIWIVSLKNSDTIWWKHLLQIRDLIVCKMPESTRNLLCCAPKKVQLQAVYEVFWPSAEAFGMEYYL